MDPTADRDARLEGARAQVSVARLTTGECRSGKRVGNERLEQCGLKLEESTMAAFLYRLGHRKEPAGSKRLGEVL